jgi:hypothetical protein
MIDDYQSTGAVDMDSLVRLLGDPTGAVSLTDPDSEVCETFGIDVSDIV